MRYTDPTKIKERMSRECEVITWFRSEGITLSIDLRGKSLIRGSITIYVSSNPKEKYVDATISWYHRGNQTKWSGRIRLSIEIVPFVVAIAVSLNGGTVGPDGFVGNYRHADNPKCWSGTNPLIDYLEETMPNNPDVMEFVDAYCRAK